MTKATPKPSLATRPKPPEPTITDLPDAVPPAPPGSRRALRAQKPHVLAEPPTAPPAFGLVESELTRVFASPAANRGQGLRLALEALRPLWPAPPPDEPQPETQEADAAHEEELTGH